MWLPLGLQYVSPVYFGFRPQDWIRNFRTRDLDLSLTTKNRRWFDVLSLQHWLLFIYGSSFFLSKLSTCFSRLEYWVGEDDDGDDGDDNDDGGLGLSATSLRDCLCLYLEDTRTEAVTMTRMRPSITAPMMIRVRCSSAKLVPPCYHHHCYHYHCHHYHHYLFSGGGGGHGTGCDVINSLVSLAEPRSGLNHIYSCRHFWCSRG